MSLQIFEPSSITSTQNVVAALPGFIRGGKLRYTSSTQVTPDAGIVECNGAMFEIEANAHTIQANAAGADWRYFYIDFSESTPNGPATIIDSLTPPIWSATKLGWYNGDDRCIGSWWTSVAGLNIGLFNTLANGNRFVGTVKSQAVQTGNPTGGWVTVDLSQYIPVNASAMLFTVLGIDGSASVTNKFRDKNTGETMGNLGWNQSQDYAWLGFVRGSNGNYEWLGENDDDNQFRVDILGFQIEV